MKVDNNYTGIAKPVLQNNGDYALLACKYEQVGMYGTCLKMEGGKVVAIGLGGFHEETAFSETKGGKYYPIIIHHVTDTI